MNLKLTEAELAFEAEVRTFIDTHWPVTARGNQTSLLTPVDRTPEQQGWFDALIERGWSVAHWPTEFGGTGWTPTQHYIWDRETTRAGCPDMSIFGVSMLGPVPTP